PIAYMALHVLPGIEARSGAKFEYVPVLLGGIFKATGNQSPVMAFGHIKNKIAYDMLEMRRFVEKHGLARFNMNPHFPVNTLLLMRLATAAKIDGVLPAYLAAAFPAMWEKGLKMDDPEIVRAELAAAGLDSEKLMARAQEHDVKAALMAETEHAVARGAFGIPTFFVGEDMYFGKDRLRDVEEAIAA
ncbi:MAG: 2-hydroxychromene-2-carboxylate isomerase, partial [Hyphomonadaceae bacterium]